MNLRSLANSATQIVNKNITAIWRSSTGYSVNADFSRSPDYSDTEIKIQSQAISSDDLKHIQELNIQGILRSVYIYGNLQGVVRADEKGGDLLIFKEVPSAPDRTWKVIKVVETWPDWSHVIACMMNPDTLST
jgi:hypothetical protein